MKESPVEGELTGQDSDFAEVHSLSLNKSKAPRPTDFVLAPSGAVFYTTLSPRGASRDRETAARSGRRE